MSNLSPHPNGLSQIEKFAFSLFRSAFCHSVAMPIHRYGTILQLKNTIIELDDGDECNYNAIAPTWTHLVTDKNSSMSVYYRTLLLLTSHGTAQIFKEKIKRKINVQRTDKRYVRIAKRVLFSTVTRVITFSFGHWFSYMQSMCSINRVPVEGRWHFGVTQPGFAMLCMTTVIDQLLWYWSYYWFAPYLTKPIHSKIRTYASNFLIHPLYTIMRRQMLTNESMLTATRSLTRNYGYMSLFNGALCEITRSIVYDLCGKAFDYALKKYVLWKYDVYGIKNTLNLCKEYVEIAERDHVLVQGYIRAFQNAEDECNPYIPQSIIDLIANEFYHEKEFDILDAKLNKFVYQLSTLNLNRREQNAFLNDEELQNKVKSLFEDKRFQRLWKNKIHCEMQRRNEEKLYEASNHYNYRHHAELSSSTINNRYNCYYFGAKNIVFYCDLCEDAIESKRMCRFKKCGHCLCQQCRRKLRLKRKCAICDQKWTRNKNYYYLIPKNIIHAS